MTDQEVSIVKKAEEPHALAPRSVQMLDLSGPIDAATKLGKEGVEVLERLFAMREKEMAHAADEAMADAMAEFQRIVPVIPKGKEAKQVRNDGTVKHLYNYAPLSLIDSTIKNAMAACGLSKSFASKVDAEKGLMTVTCTIRHRNGGTRTAEFIAVIAGTDLMSDSQKAASATTFAMRYALVQALGLTTADEDDDGRGGGGTAPVSFIDASQEAALSELLEKFPDKAAERTRVLDYAKAKNLSEIQSSLFATIRDGLNAKIAKFPKAKKREPGAEG